jgi:hypothetical protein
VIKNTLRSIRQKPQAVREQYAFWIACVLTSMVAVVWFMTGLDNTQVLSTSEAEQEAAVANTDTLSDFFSGAQEQISAVQQEVMEVLPAATSSTDLTSTSATATSSAAAVISTPPAAAEPVVREVRIATTSQSESGE